MPDDIEQLQQRLADLEETFAQYIEASNEISQIVDSNTDRALGQLIVLEAILIQLLRADVSRTFKRKRRVKQIMSLVERIMERWQTDPSHSADMIEGAQAIIERIQEVLDIPFQRPLPR